MGGQPSDAGFFGGQLKLLNWAPPTSVKNGAGTLPILQSPATYVDCGNPSLLQKPSIKHCFFPVTAKAPCVFGSSDTVPASCTRATTGGCGRMNQGLGKNMKNEFEFLQVFLLKCC